MQLLEERIRREGQIRPGGILKVDNFLNHQIDTALLFEMAKEFKRLFEGETVTKVLTIEASGIAMASMTAYLFSVPLVFAKKSKSVVSREYLNSGDRVLIIDDFLATGAALVGLKQLVEMAGGTVVGAGIAVEKAFQGGGDKLRAGGLRIESLAKIESMTDAGEITFC